MAAPTTGCKLLKLNSGDEQFRLAAKFVFLGVIAGLAFLTGGETRDVVRAAIADAYIEVSTFVAATLALFYFAEHALKLDTAYLLNRYRAWHVPIAAVMGALPGCGGAIVVITQYVSGRLGFGAVVAVLCSTMGDAAFLLLAQEPQTALLVYAISMTAGVTFGYLVEFIHGKDFLKYESPDKRLVSDFGMVCGMPSRISPLRKPWIALMVPGLSLGIGAALQADTDAWFGPLAAYEPTTWIGLTGAFLCATMWALSPNMGPSVTNLTGNVAGPHPYKCLIDRVAIDTNFVTVWVITAFLLFELALLWLDLDLHGLFEGVIWLMPLMATFIGFIPGCGPQIIVTTMYLNGIVPFSALIANAISNDGDALFPAIALAPKAAILATLYTAVPALLISYGWLIFAE
ncbi:MAG: hypothetical protein EOM26_02820 [Alphaproteobacteria bacterium]|nr:hypothetical protein [Alphaproteobacteria bacterium]